MVNGGLLMVFHFVLSDSGSELHTGHLTLPGYHTGEAVGAVGAVGAFRWAFHVVGKVTKK